MIAPSKHIWKGRTPLLSGIGRIATRLRNDRSGVAFVEFALSLPILMGLTMYGAEAANMAYASQKIGDLATLTADSVSRVRISISENDVTDILGGVKILGDDIRFQGNGRIIVSSIQPVFDSAGAVVNQKIRWQRCAGSLRSDSSYGNDGATLGTTGMGPTGRKITATASSEVIFVEVSYAYRPLISDTLFGAKTFSAVASMAVRERNTNDLQNSGTKSLCSNYTA